MVDPRTYSNDAGSTTTVAPYRSKILQNIYHGGERIFIRANRHENGPVVGVDWLTIELKVVLETTAPATLHAQPQLQRRII